MSAKDGLTGVGVFLLIFAIIGGAIWWNASIWSECRTDHSWSYCMRVLSK